MERLDNLYYAQYVNKRRYSSEPAYDSDNKEIDNRDESKYMQWRNKQESLYKNWLRQRHNLEQEYQKRMKDILIKTGKNFVKYIFKYEGNSEVFGGIEIFEFKITLIYCKFGRKWYISPSYSFVPEVIDFKGKLNSGTYYPISETVLRIIYEIKQSIDAYMICFVDVHQFMYNAKKSYKDIQFFGTSKSITEIGLIFTENAWPNGLQKLNIRDRIIVKLELNKDVHSICNMTYEYECTRLSKNIKNNNKKLQLKMKYFYDYPLETAFKKFMEEENDIE